MYWADVTSAGLHPSEPDEVDVGKDVDLSTPEGVDILPSQPAELFLHPEGGFEGQEAARYMALRARLEVAVAEQRKQRGRLEGYRRLKRLLEPFENAESEVQGNLVVKDGELGRELERLRVLVARVTGALGEMNESEGSRQTGDMGAGEEEDRREGRRDMLSEVMDVL